MDGQHTEPAGEGGLREQLGRVEGVESVVIDAASGEAWLILRADADPQGVEALARPLVGESGLQVAVRPERRDRQRVRFVEVGRDMTAYPEAEVRVTLEWGGKEYHGTARGDARGAVELRIVAQAALDAVMAIVPEGIQLRLSGVKQVRAFDADLVIVSLYRSEGQPRNLVGVVVQGDDARRATAVAVLNALNRLLGNYLQLP